MVRLHYLIQDSHGLTPDQVGALEWLRLGIQDMIANNGHSVLDLKIVQATKLLVKHLPSALRAIGLHDIHGGSMSEHEGIYFRGDGEIGWLLKPINNGTTKPFYTATQQWSVRMCQSYTMAFDPVRLDRRVVEHQARSTVPRLSPSDADYDPLQRSIEFSPLPSVGRHIYPSVAAYHREFNKPSMNAWISQSGPPASPVISQSGPPQLASSTSSSSHDPSISIPPMSATPSLTASNVQLPLLSSPPPANASAPASAPASDAIAIPPLPSPPAI